MSAEQQYETKQPSKARMSFLVIALIVLVSTAAGFLGGRLGGDGIGGDTQSVQKQQVVLKTQGQLISSIAKNVGASVVSIGVKVAASNSVDSFFGFQTPVIQEGAGTGIILTEDGLIITNRHVVPAGTTSVSVTLSDGTLFDNVEVIGRTASSDSLDIAFLKIKDTKGKQLKPATIGDSTRMEVGEPVVAIGNALGQLQNTVTSGIISGFGRSVRASDASGAESENLVNLFQTDAAINQGNSGGPLVNLDGEVIGINTAVAAGGAQNIGFAIPINDVSGMIKSVKDKGKLERPYLGIVFIPVNPGVAEKYGLKITHGAYLPPSELLGQNAIIDDGPAAKAGLKEGDVIVKINNEKIDEKRGLTSLLGKYQSGNKIQITVVRDGQEQSFDVTLGAAPGE